MNTPLSWINLLRTFLVAIRYQRESYVIKKFSDELETMFNQQFSTSLSYQDMHRARQDLKLLLSIKRKLRKLPVIIRQSDKSGVLHIGYKSDYERKVLAYQEKTKAYVELASNPMEEHLL